MTRQRAGQLIRFATVEHEMRETGVPAPVVEAQARYLWRLDPDERAIVAWRVDEENSGRGFERVSGAQVRRIADEVAASVGEEIAPLRAAGMVQTYGGPGGVGPNTLAGAGFYGYLNRLDRAARQMAEVFGGPEGIMAAVEEIPEAQAVQRIEQVERVFRVALALMLGCMRRWPEGPAEGQERWVYREDWDWAEAALPLLGRLAANGQPPQVETNGDGNGWRPGGEPT